MNDVTTPVSAREQFICEFQHVRSKWCWLFCYGVLLAVSGAVAVIVPAVTVSTSVFAMIFLGVSLMVSGIATIVAAVWAGRWSGMLPQILCGVLYIVAGYVISDEPISSAIMMAGLIAALFIVLGLFRVLAAIIIQFPHWGWALLNGVITFLCGVVIYRHFRKEALWVVGLLVGLELLFHGWTWIMMSLAIRNMPDGNKTEAPAHAL